MALTVDEISGVYFCARPQLQQFLVRRVKCHDTAAELLQELYLRLPHLKPPPETEGEVRAWLYRVAGNLSIDHIRTQNRHGDLLQRYCADESEEDLAATPEQIAMFSEEIQRIQALLAKLPPRCAQILRLNRLEGLTYSEVGVRLGISRSLVEKEMVKILDHLRSALDDDAG
jgi:RNA polymerase sigma factor (sigma-70 family)